MRTGNSSDVGKYFKYDGAKTQECRLYKVWPKFCGVGGTAPCPLPPPISCMFLNGRHVMTYVLQNTDGEVHLQNQQRQYS